MSLFTELKRRNVFRVAAAYVVVGWLVTEVGSTVLQIFAAPDWVAKALILIIALGFLPAIFFSWVYELTPEGVKKEKQVDPDTSITSETGRKLDLVTIAAVVIGIGFLGFSKFLSPPSATSPSAVTGSGNETPTSASADFQSMLWARSGLRPMMRRSLCCRSSICPEMRKTNTSQMA